MGRCTVTLVLAVALAVLAGCRGGAPEAVPEYITTLSQLAYPADAPHGPDLDLVLVRQGDAVKLVNLTARPYRDLQLWLNEQYVGLVDVIEIGNPIGGNRLPLSRFVNRHGEAFPVGSFLSPDKGISVVLAELYDPATGLRYRVRVQSGKS